MTLTFVQPKLVCGLKTRELAKRIVEFGELLCQTRMGRRITLYNYQRVFAVTIIESVLLRNGAEPTALYSRQSGKSEVLAVVALACAVLIPVLAREFPDDPRLGSFLRGFRIGIYAFKQDKAQIIYDRMREYATTQHALDIYADHELSIEMTASRGNSCAWSNGSYVLAQTASDQTDNEGETWDLLIIDEAQKISTFKVDKELRPMLTSTNGPLVQIGTASFSKGVFYKSIMRNLEIERETGYRLHFQYDYEAVIAERQARYEAEVERYNKFVSAPPRTQAKMLEADPGANRAANDYHLNYKRHIERQLAANGNNRDEETFKMNYRLIWADNRSIAIHEAHFKSLRFSGLEKGSLAPDGSVLAAGLDIAGGDSEGADYSVLTIGLVDVLHPIPDKDQVRERGEAPLLHYNKVVLDWSMFSGSFEHEQYGGIVRALWPYPGVRVLYVDATGMGDPVAERLQMLLPHIAVVPFTFSLQNKSMGYKKYLEEVKNARIRYPAGIDTVDTLEYKRFVSEHVDLQRTYKGGLMVCEHQEGGHDDFPDSMMLFNLAADHAVAEYSNRPMQVESTYLSRAGNSGQIAAGASGGRAARYRGGRAR